MHPRCKPEDGMTKSYIFFSLDHCYKCTLNTFQARFVFISINPRIKSKHLLFTTESEGEWVYSCFDVTN